MRSFLKKIYYIFKTTESNIVFPYTLIVGQMVLVTPRSGVIYQLGPDDILTEEFIDNKSIKEIKMIVCSKEGIYEIILKGKKLNE